MKRYSVKVLILAVLLIYSSQVWSQEITASKKSIEESSLVELNDFIKNAFPKTYKFKERKVFPNENREVVTSLKTSLVSFKNCKIKFAVSVNSVDEESSEQISFSLKDIDAKNTSFYFDSEDMTISFSSNSNSIFSKLSLGIAIPPEREKTYRESILKRKSFFIRLKPVVNPTEVKNALLKAVSLCQEIK